MFRSIWLPSIIACIIALPFLFDSAGDNPSVPPSGNSPNVFQQAGYSQSNPNIADLNSPNATNVQNGVINYQTAPVGNPVFNPNAQGMGNPAMPLKLPGQQASHSTVGLPTQPGTPATHSSFPANQPIVTGFEGFQGVPDLGAAQTYVFAGDENGPNLNAPLSFVPTTDFREIFRFDISQSWMKQRWKRVSTCPADPGLHGLRVGLVTGTNSWDLHGSLTYYFDGNHRPQRITFRGWSGDSSRLEELLKQAYGFRAYQTHWAGFYVAKNQKNDLTGGMLMQYPSVVYTDNPIQQVAIVLEINNPQGKFVLSNEFRSLIEGSLNSK